MRFDPPALPEPAGGPLPTRVLIADDDDEMRALMAQALRDDGYEVREAANGFEALLGIGLDRGVALDGVDLIITDVRMPGLSGTELLYGLRALELAVPVVLISAFLDPEAIHDALERGAAAVLSKPFSLEQLRGAVKRAAPPRPGPRSGR